MADDASWSAGAEAVGEAPRRARVSYSDEIGQEICDRLTAGESLMSICRDEAMPHRDTVREWGWRHGHFGEAMLQAVRMARLRRRRAELKRAMIPRDNRGRWSSYTPERGGEICRRLMGGESLIAICRDEGMPHYSTVLNWARALPEFGEAYGEARRLAADYLFDEAREIAVATTPATERADRLRFDILRWQAARIAPRKYQERMVVVAAMDERLAERQAALEARAAAGARARMAGFDWAGAGLDEEETAEAAAGLDAEVIEAEAEVVEGEAVADEADAERSAEAAAREGERGMERAETADEEAGVEADSAEIAPPPVRRLPEDVAVEGRAPIGPGQWRSPSGAAGWMM